MLQLARGARHYVLRACGLKKVMSKKMKEREEKSEKGKKKDQAGGARAQEN